MKAPASSLPSVLSETGNWRLGKRWVNRPPIILVAEDDLADQELIRRALADQRCELQIVPDGVELINYLKTCRDPDADDKSRLPDIILLDLNMPRKDGRQALREIREMEKVPALPIVVFSTSDNLADIKECYESGCNSYITKPSELDEFNAAIENVASYWLNICALP